MLRTKKNKITIVVLAIALFGLLSVTTYHIYCHYMVSKFYRCMDSGDTEKILAQVEKMPNVNMLNPCPPLYHIVGILTQNSFINESALEYAVYKEADISVLEALLIKGADPNLNAAGSVSAFEDLCYNPTWDWDKKIELMVAYGADIDSIRILIHGKYLDDFTDPSTEMYFNAIMLLWENGASDKAYGRMESEQTILHDVAGRLDTEYLSRLYHNEKRDMAYLLNEQDAHGETPIFYAVRSNNFGNCKFLIEEGADLSIKNNEGKTVYEVAVELQNNECAQVIKKYIK